MEIMRDDAVFRVVDDTAAIAYPDLLLVEHGKWGEAVRQLADVWLPWMPYRSNWDLARWFQVERLDREDVKRPDLVFLRLRPAGSAEDAGTYMEAAFSRRDGLARLWEFYQNGIRTGRLRFAGASGKDAQRGSDEVVLEDGSGKQLARWELIAWEPESPAIPDLTEGWEGYIQLDRRSERPAVDRAFAEALEAVHRFEWERALAALAEAEEIHLHHPLLQLLTAWCHERQPVFNSRNRILAALGQVAAGQATGLTRFIDQGNFPGLEAGQLYDLLVHQPESTRSAADLDRLAEAATGAGRLQEAVTHTEAALALGGADGRRFERTRRRVELLLRLGRADVAMKAVNAWSGEHPRPAEELATMGEVLAKFGQVAEADRLFSQGLDQGKLEPGRRYELLVRLATILTGMRRWNALLEAASLQPASSVTRRQCLDTILAELDRAAHSAIAGRLAERTEDPGIRLMLLLRQAELSADRRESSEIVWGICKSGELPDARLAWACQTWNGAGQPKHVVEAAEERLRSEHSLADDVRTELEAAYRSVGRVSDAQRAASIDPETAPVAPVLRE
jgi:tetratricopeptide (TPR) repeat protein